MADKISPGERPIEEALQLLHAKIDVMSEQVMQTQAVAECLAELVAMLIERADVQGDQWRDAHDQRVADRLQMLRRAKNEAMMGVVLDALELRRERSEADEAEKGKGGQCS